MKVIYIAGPYRAVKNYQIILNIRHAQEATARLLKAGWAVLCPHLNYALFDWYYDIPDETYLEAGMELLRRCDAIYMLDNFKASKGALIELDEALKLGKEIYYESLWKGREGEIDVPHLPKEQDVEPPSNRE